jgi:delta1-piperideine-2-carboxylate reductase
MEHNPPSVVPLTLAEARDLALRALRNNGCDDDNAAAVADNMIEAERDICAAHGLFRLPWYVSSLRSGKANGRAVPRLEQLAPAVTRLHGDRGFAPLGHRVGLPVLVQNARQNGIAALAYVDMYHVAALWPEVEWLAQEGMVALAFTASFPYVAPAGGIKPLFGTNPVGFAWPRPGQPPLVFDQASAAMARGDVMIAARERRQLPEGVGLDREGRPTTDPDAVLAGSQLAFGGYKGAALAMMVELLAGPLIGDLLSFEAKEDDAGAGAAPHGGELILALDPRRFGDPAGHLERGERLFAAILEQPGTRLPGARRLANRERTAKEGITVPKSLYDSIIAVMESP